MIIRPCTYDDEDAVYALICELEGMELDLGDFARVYRGKLTDEQCRCLAGEENGAVVAFLGMNIREMLHHAAKVATIDEFIVREPLRGKGYGTLMLAEARRIAGEAGCDDIELTSSFEREKAHGFYESHGFERSSYKFFSKLG